MKHSLMKLTGMLAIAGLIALGCDSVVDHNSSNTSELQEQSPGISLSIGSSGLLDPFTQEELDDNWIADRKYPTGGVESVSFDGRDNVAKIGVIAAEQDTDSFQHFEGIKKVDDFGNHVQVDLYVPSEWQDADVVNVGFWSSDDPITAYPLIVYRNGTNVDAGFYTYDVVYDDDAGNWVGVYNLSSVPVNYNGWNTLAITLETDDEQANYAINGVESGNISAFGDNIGEVFLNHYNDGVRDYFAYWHNGDVALDPETRQDCMRGGWEEFGFRNQGQCIRYVNTGQDSR